MPTLCQFVLVLRLALLKATGTFFFPKGTATIYFLTGNLNLGTIKKWGQLYFF